MRNQQAAAAHPKLLSFHTVLALTVIGALPVSAQSLADALGRMDKTAQQFKAVAADIRRDTYTAVINEHDIDMGTIKARREKSHGTRMLIDFTSPDAKTVSIDGPNVSVYLPKSRTVDVYDIGSKRNLVDQFLLLGFGATSADLKEHYDVTLIGVEKVGTENTWHLQLVPKSADVLQHLKKAELWIDQTSGLPAQQRFMLSAGGDFQLVMFSNVKFNPPLSEGALKLNYPKGVTVEHPRL